MWALADEYSDVAQLAKNGKYAEALSKADQYLAQKPRDPQMRFIKGVVQRDSGKTSDAITTFTRLTEDYPELPEPYNNLAVLYAGEGQYDKARNALEMAIRTNPSYATAHENLGDVYAKLASQAYNKALQLDSNNTVVPPKLALIRELFSPNTNGKSKPSTIAPTSNAPTVSKAPPTLPVQAGAGNPSDKKTPSAPVSAPVATTPTTTPSTPATAANNSGTPAKSAASDTDKTAQKPDKDIETAVRAWAKAWANKDMKAYFAAYSKEFDTPANMSRKSWEDDRTQKITSKKTISVKVEGIKITLHNNRASAKFRQEYKAGGLAVSSNKTLDLVKNGDRWLITRESVN
ncbi:tetratricopeptide repeat protein [Curvibacter sp. CHRR-16]|nr:tetratricopeptide repeat protein [Curvibacter sp. CHRR-16]